VRIALFILVFLNLAYFAWATLIDRPAPAQASQSIAGIPRLVLASEATHQPNGTAEVASAAPPRCVSVGPFNTLERATAAAALLSQRGLEPKQRAEESETWDGYWVYVGGLRNAFEEARVIRTLEQAGLSDARIMPETGAGRRVSVGLFSERVRAERRARALVRLGLKPEIAERHVPGSIYWLDLTLEPDDRTLSTEGLLAPEEAGSRLEVKVCPASENREYPNKDV
jgi:hypothetical protein